MEWSYDLLTVAEQAVFRRLAACSGWFEAAEAVAADAAGGNGQGEGVEHPAVAGLFGNLVDKSLVLFDGERYKLLQTLQAFAAARLVDAGETKAARDRHAAHCLARAEAAAELLGRDLRPRLLADLERDHDNLRATKDPSAMRCRAISGLGYLSF